MRLELSLPYSPYKVPAEVGKTLAYANLTSNRTLGAGYSRSPFRRLVAGYAREQMKNDAWRLAKYTTQRSQEPRCGTITSVVVSTIIIAPTRARKDRDNALSGLKACFDGIATALGCDDSLFTYKSVEFLVGRPETRLVLEVE